MITKQIFLFVQLLLSLSLIKIHDSKSPNILVIGGSGRVGGSGVRSLLRKGYNVDIGGRREETWIDYKNHYNDRLLDNSKFVKIDISNSDLVRKIIPNYNIIVNTAGPFQGIRKLLPFETCLELGIKYLDVCDDIKLSQICRSKHYQQIAKSTNAIAIMSTGIWPGGSSLLAQNLIKKLKSSNADIDKVVFSFFTAGSGGAGETILTATFLLLGENVLTYVDGKPQYQLPASDSTMINFGKYIGEREVVRLNLIECESCFQSSNILNIETFFGTAPAFWNSLFIMMARLTPQSILQNRSVMKSLSQISLPMVRLVDYFVGSRNGIKVDAYNKKDKCIGTALMVHEDLETAVGDSLAAFVHNLLKQDTGSIAPGVYFPEEVPNEEYRRLVLQDISSAALEYSLILR